MTRLSILFLAVALSAASLSARTIRGEVRADNDSTALAGALCRLMDGKQFIDGVTTDQAGHFNLSTDIKSNLTLGVSMAGFDNTEILIDNGKSVDVGTVYLSQGITLKEVEVTANAMVDIKGRTVIFPSAADVRASTTALSLFQKLPLAGLTVNPINR